MCETPPGGPFDPHWQAAASSSRSRATDVFEPFRRRSSPRNHDKYLSDWSDPPRASVRISSVVLVGLSVIWYTEACSGGSYWRTNRGLRRNMVGIETDDRASSRPLTFPPVIAVARCLGLILLVSCLNRVPARLPTQEACPCLPDPSSPGSFSPPLDPGDTTSGERRSPVVSFSSCGRRGNPSSVGRMFERSGCWRGSARSSTGCTPCSS